MHSITVVCATRMSEEEFATKSLLGMSLAQYRAFPIKSKIFFNNTKGLSTRTMKQYGIVHPLMTFWSLFTTMF
jgi:hypothetical protein